MDAEPPSGQVVPHMVAEALALSLLLFEIEHETAREIGAAKPLSRRRSKESRSRATKNPSKAESRSAAIT
jgi:hypothetical protein